jgi:hypothetical protein
MTQKLMPFDPTLLTPPTGSSMAQLTTALTTLNTTISAGGVPVGGLPAATTPASPVATLATLTATPAVVKQQPIDQKEIDATIKAMVADAKGNTTDNRLLTIDNLIDIIVEGKLNTEAEFKQIFQTRNQTKMKRGVTKNEIVVAMANNKKAVEYLENIAYGLLMKNQSAADSWTQMKAGTNHKDEYDARILAGNGRKRNKKAQNKAHVNLSEISKILQKYR